MPTLDLPGGRRLAYREEGTGAPMVLVHGSPGEGRSWARVAPHLAASHRLLMPDLPGYGGSDPLPEDVADRTAAMGAAVAALVASCDAPVRLAGHSYGGNVALHAALLAPERIHGLTLFEPVFMRALALAGVDAVLADTSRFFMAYADQVMGGDSDAVSRMVDFWFGSGAFGRLPPPVQGFLRGAAPKNAVDVRASFAEQVPRAALAGFTRPVLVGYGGASPPVAPAIARALAALLPQARAVEVPGASHGMLDSHPQDVARCVAANALPSPLAGQGQGGGSRRRQRRG